MLITAEQNNIRQAPRKVRLVANAVKKKGLEGSIASLAVITRRSSLVILKVIKQALANAKANHQLEPSDLQLKEIIVSDGSVYKRMRAVSRGRGFLVSKKTCHLKVVLETKPKQEATTGEQETAKNSKESK